MLVIIAIIIGLVLWGYCEYSLYKKRIRSIPIRILVNGSRGKSSVTRLIAAGLRGGGIKTIAKATGTEACLIDEKGADHPLLRITTPSIGEQLGIVKRLKELKPEALVVECMAIQPQFQWIMEHQMMNSTLGVITNSKLDHIMEMGPTSEQITRSLANTIPPNGILFTADKQASSLFAEEAKKRKTQMRIVSAQDVTEDEVAKFSYIEHKDNITLALDVCAQLGVERQKALQAMWSAKPDAGVLKKTTFFYQTKLVTFINAFAANDPQSTLNIWHKMCGNCRESLFILLNSRIDRFIRSKQLVDVYVQNMHANKLFLVGEETANLKRRAERKGADKSKVINLGQLAAQKIVDRILEQVHESTTIFAIGNMGGGGSDIVNLFESLSRQQIQNSGLA